MYGVKFNLIRGLIMILIFYQNGKNNPCEAKDVRAKEIRRNDCDEDSIKFRLYRSCAFKRSASVGGSEKAYLRTHRLESFETELNSEEMDALYNEILGFTPHDFQFYGGSQKHGGRRQIQMQPQRFFPQYPQPKQQSTRQIDHNSRPSMIFPGMVSHSRQIDFPDYAALFDPLASNMDTNKKRMLRQAISNLLQICCGDTGCNPKDFRKFCADL